MRTLPETILYHGKQLPEGGILTPKEFLHLGSRAAVDQAFSRLARAGLLIRVARGLYVAPVVTESETRAPAVAKTVSSLARKTQEPITSCGAQAASALGLIQHKPIREVFLTNGRGRTLKFNGAEVEVLHVPKWMLLLNATLPGAVIRALAWLGEANVHIALKTLRARLCPDDWKNLRSVWYLLPSWMVQAIGTEMPRTT
ncbi:DUF6088 family protein [Aeromonas veronii]|uniref:DUF6088 family protein n=1 Tax=Aeromonas veronii TaxID=654 RepID=UPI000CD49AF3|nr:hypothetical protein C2849_17890 [Aeromonas veronii]